jgi:hypothetical protein
MGLVMTCRDRTPSSHPRARVVVGGSPPFNEPNTSHPFGRGPIDRRAAGVIIAGEEVLLVAKAADDLFVPAVKAPGIDADPAQVLHGNAHVGQLPVEYGANPVLTDRQIAVPEVAMDQTWLCRRRAVLG